MSHFRFCSECGASLSSQDKFCKKCGHKLLRRVQETKVTPPPSPQPPKQTRTIQIDERETKEIASSLIFTAGALLPFKRQDGTLSRPDTDDIVSIQYNTRFVEKLLSVYPQINDPSWLGYNEYKKVVAYLSTQSSEKPIPSRPRIVYTQPKSTPSSPSLSPSSSSQVRAQDNISSSEPILGTISDCKTIFPSIKYILFFTDRRIIAAKKGLFDSFTEGGAATGGIMGALIGAGLDATLKRGRKDKVEELSQLTPDQILAKDKNNHEIRFNTIKVIELKNPGFLSDGEINVKTQKSEYNWIMEVDKDTFKAVITLIQNIVPDKVLIK